MVYSIYILYIIVAPLPGLLLFVINFIIRGCNPDLDFYENAKNADYPEKDPSFRRSDERNLPKAAKVLLTKSFFLPYQDIQNINETQKLLHRSKTATSYLKLLHPNPSS